VVVELVATVNTAHADTSELAGLGDGEVVAVVRIAALGEAAVEGLALEAEEAVAPFREQLSALPFALLAVDGRGALGGGFRRLLEPVGAGLGNRVNLGRGVRIHE